MPAVGADSVNNSLKFFIAVLCRFFSTYTWTKPAKSIKSSLQCRIFKLRFLYFI